MFRKSCFLFGKNRCGQQMLEYIILVAAVIVVVIYFAAHNGVFHRLVNDVAASPAGMIRQQTAGDLN